MAARLRRAAAVLIAAVMALTMVAAAFADQPSQGQTGSITITNADRNVSFEGKTFKAYKVLDAQQFGDGYVYTVPAGLKAFYAEKFGINQDAADFDAQVVAKIAAMDSDSDALFAFAAEVLEAAKATGSGVTPVKAAIDITGTPHKATFSNLPLGYYVIEDEGANSTSDVISALMLDTPGTQVSITVKSDLPTIDKKIVDGANKVEADNTALGDTVSYEVTTNLPKDISGYKTYFFVVTDTLTKGLTLDKNSIEVKVGDSLLTKDTDYTVTVATSEDSGATVLEIVLKDVVGKCANETYALGSPVTITYNATVNANAVIGVEGNPNAVTLTYSNNPNVDAKADEDNPDKPTKDSPVGTTPEEKTYTYLTGITIVKVDPDGKPLANAEFTLEGDAINTVLVYTEKFQESTSGTYWKLTNGTYTTADPSTMEDTSAYESTDKKYELVSASGKQEITKNDTVKVVGTTDANGYLTFDGLAEGNYTITETKAPAGYKVLTKPIELEITWTAPANIANPTCTWEYKWTPDSADKDLISPSTDSANTIVVENNAGSELPSTGGMGTTIFYVVGGVLVAVAATALVVRSVRSSKR